MDQVEVEPVHRQSGQARIEGAQRRVVAVVRVVQLRGDEDCVPRDLRAADRSAHFPLVAVHGGRVDAAVTGVEGGAHGGLGLRRRDQVHTEADLRDRHPVAERNGHDRRR
jgi:hypothetical protein